MNPPHTLTYPRMFNDEQATFLYTKLRQQRNAQNPARSQAPFTREEIEALLLAQNQQDLANAKKAFLHTFVPMSIVLAMEWFGLVKNVSPLAKAGGAFCLVVESLYIMFLTQIKHDNRAEVSKELVDTATKLGIT